MILCQCRLPPPTACRPGRRLRSTFTRSPRWTRATRAPWARSTRGWGSLRTGAASETLPGKLRQLCHTQLPGTEQLATGTRPPLPGHWASSPAPSLPTPASTLTSRVISAPDTPRPTGGHPSLARVTCPPHPRPNPRPRPAPLAVTTLTTCLPNTEREQSLISFPYTVRRIFPASLLSRLVISNLNRIVRCGKTLWGSWQCLEVVTQHLPRSHAHKLNHYCQRKQTNSASRLPFISRLILYSNVRRKLCFFVCAHYSLTQSHKRPHYDEVTMSPPKPSITLCIEKFMYFIERKSQISWHHSVPPMLWINWCCDLFSKNNPKCQSHP